MQQSAWNIKKGKFKKKKELENKDKYDFAVKTWQGSTQTMLPRLARIARKTRANVPAL